MWVELADETVVRKTGEAPVGRGVHVEFLNSKEDALERKGFRCSSTGKILTFER